MHINLLAGLLNIARGKSLAHSAQDNAYLGNFYFRCGLQHPRKIAPGQKLAVGRHITNQLKHFSRAVINNNGFMDRFHTMATL